MAEQFIFLLTGSDAFSRNQAQTELVNTYLEPEWADFNFEKLDLESCEPGEILDKWLMPPFGGNARLILVDYTRANEKQVSVLLAAFSSYLASKTLSEANRIIINLKSVDKRKKEVKALLKHAQTHHQDFQPILSWNIEKQLYPWIEEQVRRQGKRITRPAIGLLATALGADKYAIQKALDKILLYLADSDLIDETLVKDMVHQTEADVFKLLEFLAQRDVYKAQGLLQTLLLKEKSPHPIIAAIASNLRKIYQSKHMLGHHYAPEDIAKQLSMHPFKLKKDLQLWQSYSFKELDKKLRRLLALDVQTKRSTLKPDLALEIWIHEFVK